MDPTLAADVATFAERATAAMTAHNARCRAIASKPAHMPQLPEHHEIEALRGAMVTAADARHRGAALADRVTQAVYDAGADVSAELRAAAEAMVAALRTWRVIEDGSLGMLRNSGEAGAVLAAAHAAA